jgi:hypothetical protein
MDFFISVTTAERFELAGWVVLVLALLVAWGSARRRSRAVQAQIFQLRKEVDQLQRRWERILLTTINRDVQLFESPPLNPTLDTDKRQLSFGWSERRANERWTG